MEQRKERKSIGDFDGTPLEFLNFVYRSGNASLRTRFECAMFLVRLERELQQERDEKALGKFKGEAIDLHKAAYKNENLPLKTRLDCAKYVTEYEIRQKQLELPLNDRMSTIVTLKPVSHETATEKGITEEVH